MEDLVGTIRVRDDGDGACVVQWTATFEPVGIADEDAVQIVSGIFQSGLDALQLETWTRAAATVPAVLTLSML